MQTCSWCHSVVSASRCLSSRRTELVVSFPGSVEERSTASSCSTWRNIVQRCACASKIPTAIAITAASSRAKTLSHANPDPQQKSRVQLETWQACFLSHCVEVFYFGKTILGKFTCPLPAAGSKASVKKRKKKIWVVWTGITVFSLHVPGKEKRKKKN